MHTVQMKKKDTGIVVKLDAHKAPKGHAFSAAGFGRNTRFVERKSRRGEKQRVAKEVF